MHLFAASLSEYKRLPTREVRAGDLLIGNFNPIRLQTMTTADTMDTMATVEETIRCIRAGAELVRITAPSKKEAENLGNIKAELVKRGYHTPLVADIHFTPNAAEIAARLVEKVRVNPGNYVDKKKFEQIDYTDTEYAIEIERIREKFIPLLKICKEYGTAMRIGTNHGSLSDRIMSRYGDTPIGMVESAMEFLRVARDENYHNIVLSMKSSNPQVMVEAYRLLAQAMYTEFGECYPLHLGVTEAGDGEDGRVKSAAGMGTLLEDGLGDTVRVSLTEAPEEEIPVCRDLVKRYPLATKAVAMKEPEQKEILYAPKSKEVQNIGGSNVPVVVADLSALPHIYPETLQSVGYYYDIGLDKWNISDSAADYILIDQPELEFPLPGTLKVLVPYKDWTSAQDKSKYFPLFFSWKGYTSMPEEERSRGANFIMINCDMPEELPVSTDDTVVLCMYSGATNAMQQVRKAYWSLEAAGVESPKVNFVKSKWSNADEHLIHFATEAGALFIDNYGDGICLQMEHADFGNHINSSKALSGRNYNDTDSVEQFANATAFSILQAARKRITKTEYISCPSCGRTLFDLQDTTAMIRRRTDHLKGIKIAIMGCIVNGPGEMADADFGYVGSGVGKITLYKGKEVVKRNVASEVAVDELINLLKENDAWVDPE